MRKKNLKELYRMMFINYPDIVTVQQVSEMLGISRQCVGTLLANHKIQAVKTGRSYKIPRICVIDYLISDVSQIDFSSLCETLFPKYPDIVTVPDLMDMLHISKRYAYDLISDHQIHAVRIGPSFKIPKICVIQYVASEMMKNSSHEQTDSSINDNIA